MLTRLLLSPLCALVLIATTAAQEKGELQQFKPEARIIAQADSPVKITRYTAKYQEGGSRYTKEGIHHGLEYTNQTDRTIDAIQFSLVSFDVWNEYLDRLGGITIKTLTPRGEGQGEWVTSAYADFSFHTGVAYVSKVRFNGGEIWTANLEAVVQELRKIEKDFDANRLKSKPPPDTKK